MKKDINSRVLIIGGSGFIGYRLVKFLSEKKFDVNFTYLKNRPTNSVGSHRLDITDRESTLNLFKTTKPKLVIHSSALTNVDLCEENHDLADSINIDGTKNVVDACKITDSMLIYVSTSSVFDGNKDKYFEDDIKSPATYYGKTKASAEDLIINSGLSYLILRTDQPYYWKEEWQHTNSVLRVLETIKEGKIMREISDWYNNPTYLPEFVHALYELLKSKHIGIFHVVGSDYVNRYQWANVTAKIFNLSDNMIKPIHSKTLNLAAKRPNVNLSNSKIINTRGIKMSGIEEGMIKMLQDM